MNRIGFLGLGFATLRRVSNAFRRFWGDTSLDVFCLDSRSLNVASQWRGER